FKLEDWQQRLHLPEGKLAQLGQGALERMQKLPRPELQRIAPPRVPGLNMQLPAIAAPSAPDLGGAALPTPSSGVTVLVFVLLMLLAGWFLWRRSAKASTGAATAEAVLGPWPIEPEAVTTRADLVRAFDYLALKTLGLVVRSWNHHAVALRWRARDPA